jgi:hypothetical protein
MKRMMICPKAETCEASETSGAWSCGRDWEPHEEGPSCDFECDHGQKCIPLPKAEVKE